MKFHIGPPRINKSGNSEKIKEEVKGNNLSNSLNSVMFAGKLTFFLFISAV